ncbi:MAG: hypothetical protein JW839_13995 [Candidatus Lokiarchaeota archaeon]|nr:hypothetical protein [Candidatus Lokiarchaeota archaeon]
MGEKVLLAHLRAYGVTHESIAGYIAADPGGAGERLRSVSYNSPELLSPGVVSVILSHFSLNPRDFFTILHNLAAKYPERSGEIMREYFIRFDAHPEAAVGDFYYVAANDPHLVTPAFVDKLIKHIHIAPVDVITTFRHLLAKAPALIHEGVVSAIIKVIRPVGANQAFYFLRDLAVQHPGFTPLCTLALFECFLKDHNYAVKREMLVDIQSIAAVSHVKTALEKELARPAGEGSTAARALMAMLFRQRYRVQQSVLIQALDYVAHWPRLFDFFALLIRHAGRQHETSFIEKFLDGAYQLHFLLTVRDFETMLVDVVNPEAVNPASFGKDVQFLNDDEQLRQLLSIVSGLAAATGGAVDLSAVDRFKGRKAAAARELAALGKVMAGVQGTRRERVLIRMEALQRLAAGSRDERLEKRDRRALAKELEGALLAELKAFTLVLIVALKEQSVGKVAQRILGHVPANLGNEVGVFPALFLLEKLGGGNNYKYLRRLIEDKLEGREPAWVWSEPPVVAWKERVRKGQPSIVLDHWRAPFTRRYTYKVTNAEKEKKRKVGLELQQTRALFEQLKVATGGAANFEELAKKAENLPAGADPAVVEEIRVNLTRIRRMIDAPASDYEGAIDLVVETDPFQYLFMGEYGFASCLSMHGRYFWGAVSNAIDVDKVVVWAREPGGNIVGRRLIALTPEGVVSYRTYSNRFGLALDEFFKEFIDEYARYCGTVRTREGKPTPLLSDAWYDDKVI